MAAAAKERGEKQLMGITLVVVGVGLLVVGTLLFVNYRQWSGLRAQTRKYKDDVAKPDPVTGKVIGGYKYEIEVRGPEIEKELKASDARFEACRGYLPTDEDINRLLDDFAEKCVESGLKPVDIQKETITAGRAPLPGAQAVARPEYQTIRYKGEFRGSFHQLINFVGEVENWKRFRRFVSITGFSVEAANKGLTFDDKQQMHKIGMIFDLYKYQEPPALPAIPPAGAAAVRK